MNENIYLPVNGNSEGANRVVVTDHVFDVFIDEKWFVTRLLWIGCLFFRIPGQFFLWMNFFFFFELTELHFWMDQNFS